MKAYRKKPKQQHHRLSVLFLEPGSPLRAAVDIFIATGSMPALLNLQSAPFLFVPLGDRFIEREHKYLSDVVRPKTRVRVRHNCSLRRLRTIEERMAADVGFRDAIIKKYVQLKTCKGAALALALDVPDDASKSVRRFAWSVRERIVYRQDI